MEAKKSYIDKKNGRKSVVVSKQKEDDENDMTNLTWKEILEKLREEKGGKLKLGTIKPELLAILLELHDVILPDIKESSHEDSIIRNVMADTSLTYLDKAKILLGYVNDVIFRKYKIDIKEFNTKPKPNPKT